MLHSEICTPDQRIVVPPRVAWLTHGKFERNGCEWVECVHVTFSLNIIIFPMLGMYFLNLTIRTLGIVRVKSWGYHTTCYKTLIDSPHISVVAKWFLVLLAARSYGP